MAIEDLPRRTTAGCSVSGCRHYKSYKNIPCEQPPTGEKST